MAQRVLSSSAETAGGAILDIRFERMPRSIHGPLLDGGFGRQREFWLRSCPSGDETSQMLAHHGPVFESVTRAPAGDPYVVEIRVAIQQQVAIGGVLILADARLHE